MVISCFKTASWVHWKKRWRNHETGIFSRIRWSRFHTLQMSECKQNGTGGIRAVLTQWTRNTNGTPYLRVRFSVGMNKWSSPELHPSRWDYYCGFTIDSSKVTLSRSIQSLLYMRLDSIVVFGPQPRVMIATHFVKLRILRPNQSRKHTTDKLST